jgi:hypothetical protein
VLVALVAGLAAAEAVLRLARLLLPDASGLARNSQREYGTGSESDRRFLEAGVVFGGVGGLLGAFEGQLLPFPPAAILELF